MWPGTALHPAHSTFLNKGLDTSFTRLGETGDEKAIDVTSSEPTPVRANATKSAAIPGSKMKMQSQAGKAKAKASQRAQQRAEKDEEKRQKREEKERIAEEKKAAKAQEKAAKAEARARAKEDKQYQKEQKQAGKALSKAKAKGKAKAKPKAKVMHRFQAASRKLITHQGTISPCGKRQAAQSNNDIADAADRPIKRNRTSSDCPAMEVDDTSDGCSKDLASEAAAALGGQSAVARNKAAWVAKLTSLDEKRVRGALRLLEEGNTIPFIARYRKEQTGSMNEEELRKVERGWVRADELELRRCRVAVALRRRDAMTNDLQAAILGASSLEEIEDIWAPFKQKRKTRAQMARDAGLQLLAGLIERLGGARRLEDPLVVAGEFATTGGGYDQPKDALAGARDIIAEKLAQQTSVKQHARDYLGPVAWFTARQRPGTDEDGHFKTYWAFDCQLKRVKPYQFLAIQRGEANKVLSVSFTFDDDVIDSFVQDLMWRDQKSTRWQSHPSWEREWHAAISDAFKRLIRPSLEREWRRRLKEQAEDDAFDTYRKNVHNKLLTPPLRMHPEWGEAAANGNNMLSTAVLGVDPAYRTGCKLALVASTGRVLKTTTVYPHPPKNCTLPPHQVAAASAGLHDILLQNVAPGLDRLICSIGNGTASRETEAWLREELTTLETDNDTVSLTFGYTIVDEAGASVYSASPLAGRELPDLDVSMRGAVSIARRLIDPLAELVKIDPQSIGVGLYQHDVDQKRLAKELEAAVEDSVNAVGADLNTASPSLLEHVAGLSGPVAQTIVKHRESHGPFRNRSALLALKGIGQKIFHQAAGFLRIFGGDETLDATAIHPESYEPVWELQRRCGPKAEQLGKAVIMAGGDNALALELGISGAETLHDIVAILRGEDTDPRTAQVPPRVRMPSKAHCSDQSGAIDAQGTGLTVESLLPGMFLQGVVRNVVAFGAFVDIGVGHDGLLHISAYALGFRPQVNDRLDVWVQSCRCSGAGGGNKHKWRIALSMKSPITG